MKLMARKRSKSIGSKVRAVPIYRPENHIPPLKNTPPPPQPLM